MSLSLHDSQWLTLLFLGLETLHNQIVVLLMKPAGGLFWLLRKEQCVMFGASRKGAASYLIDKIDNLGIAAESLPIFIQFHERTAFRF